MVTQGDPIAVMDVTKHVDPGAGFPNSLPEIYTPNMSPKGWIIEDQTRRAMGDQDIRIPGDHIPLGSDLLTSLKVPGPIVKPGLPRRTIEVQPVSPEALIDQKHNIPLGTHSREGLRLLLREEIMVTGNEDLQGRFLFRQPVQSSGDLLLCSPSSEIPRMDQDIPIRRLGEVTVGIRDTNYFCHLGSIHGHRFLPESLSFLCPSPHRLSKVVDLVGWFT